MSRQHLPHEGGGDPSQGPVPELANEPDVPTDHNEFPDAPDESVSDRPQDQPDLDSFAARIGTDSIDSDSTGDDVSSAGDDSDSPDRPTK